MQEDIDELSLDAPWAMGEVGFGHLTSLFRDEGTRVLLEFGSGVSTTRFALADESLRIFTVDHEARFLEKAQASVGQNGVADRVQTVHAPLRWFGEGISRYCTYDLLRVDAALAEVPDASVDTVFIDGPPSWTGGGRAGLLEELMARDFYGARLVVVDDASRGMEKFAVRRLEQRATSALVSILDVGHGLGVIRPDGSPWLKMRLHDRAYLSARGALALGKQGVRRIVKGSAHP